MHCLWCGTTLPPGTTHCPSCGRSLSPNVLTATSSVNQAPSHGSLGFMTILLIILALLVMASGIGLIYYTAIFRPAQQHAQLIATVQAAEDRATAIANVQATGTAQANAHATATAQAVATAQAIATTTALQNIYKQATSGNPVFNDPLNGNNINNWDVGSASLGGSCGFTAGAYHVVEPNKNYYLTCFAQSTHFSNFAFQVTMTIVRGDEGGILFRAAGANSGHYSFGINRDGLFILIVSRDTNPGKTLLYGPYSAIHTSLNQPNTLTAIVRGATIYLYINKQYVDSITDTTYHSGEIGVYAANSKDPTDVAFNDAQVWQL